MWSKLTEIADYICQAWRRPDNGPSGEAQKPEHFVVSKIFCWAALDQIIKIATGLGQKPSNRWVSEKNILHRTICDQGYDSYKNSFTRAFGDREIDSSAVWIPLLNFLPIDDPRITGTIDRIQTELSSGVFVRKLNNLAADGEQETLDIWSSCSLVSCLALMGRIDEASDRLAEICTYISPLGLVGDDMNTENPNHIPEKFPSANAHLALVNSALYIALAKKRGKLLFPLMGGEEPQPLGKTA
jgi:GH15 family glucan-1,4-alpha-glucosidase